MSTRTSIKLYWSVLACVVGLALQPLNSWANDAEQLSKDIISQCGVEKSPDGGGYELEQLAIKDGMVSLTQYLSDGTLVQSYESSVKISDILPEARFQDGYLYLDCKPGSKENSCVHTEIAFGFMLSEYTEEDHGALQFAKCDAAAGKKLAARLSQVLTEISNNTAAKPSSISKSERALVLQVLNESLASSATRSTTSSNKRGAKDAFESLSEAASHFSGTSAEEVEYKEIARGIEVRDWAEREYSYIKFRPNNNDYCRIDFATRVIKRSQYGDDAEALLEQVNDSSSQIPVDLTSSKTLISSTSSKFNSSNIGCIRIKGLPDNAVARSSYAIEWPDRASTRLDNSVDLYCGVRYLDEDDQYKVNELYESLKQLQRVCQQ